MNFIFFLLISVVLSTSCSTQKNENSSLFKTLSSSGLIKKKSIPFPIYFTNKPEKRIDLEKKYSNNLFIMHTGHILKAELSKEENENNLAVLAMGGFNLINLTLEDFIIADNQGINFEKFDNLSFINSSVINLNLDNLVAAKNISSQFIFKGIAFIGLSDEKIGPKLNKDKFIIDDHVLAILKVKKNVLNENPMHDLKSFIIVHSLGNEISNVITRLPPFFTTLLTD